MDKIKRVILHYRLWILVILAIVEIAVYHILNSQTNIYVVDQDQESPNYAALLLLTVVWGFAAYTLIASIRYRDVTGRSLRKDRRAYGRTARELQSYFADADPYKIPLSELPYGSWRYSEGVILGKVGGRIIRRSSDEHNGDGANYALFALPGGGKTTSQIIPSAMQFGGAVLAIDIKGDILAATRNSRNIRIFAPDAPDISMKFDPLYGLRDMTMTERRVLIEQIAEILVMDDKDGRYFVEGGRDLFCGISLYLISKDISVSFPDIIREILRGDAVSWIMRIRDGDCTEAQEYTNSYYGTNEVNVSGAYGEMRKRVRTLCTEELLGLLDRDGDTLTPDVLEAGEDIYVELPQHKIKFYAPIVTILVQRFMTSFMARPDRSSHADVKPILFLLDEFPQLDFNFSTLSAGLATLRSKKVSIFLAQQSIAQLINRYGDAGCREIIDTCSYISIMSAQDPQSRKFFQELLGTRKVLKRTSGTSGTFQGASENRGTQEAREYIFQPEDFANLGDHVIVYARGRYIVAEKTYFFQD